MGDWLRVYEHELSRRRRISRENPTLYKKLRDLNPKGLGDEKHCDKHVWVPATHLMIHDNGARSYMLGGLKRRAFLEAKPYREESYHLVPQICWSCDSHRTHKIDNSSTEKRRAIFETERLQLKNAQKYGTIEPLNLF